MSTNTTNMSMGKAVDGDNARTYIETTLGAALDKIDAHDHSGTTHGLASFSASLTVATGLTITAGSVTLPGTNSGIDFSGNSSNAAWIGPVGTTLFRNNANNASNLQLTDAGLLTVRTGVTVSGGGIDVTGGAIFRNTNVQMAAGLPARAVGDLYVIINASGQLHTSAVGPTS